MSETDELARIEKRIESLSEGYLKTGQPYLLSRLGKDLGDDLRALKILSGQTLAEFMRKRLNDKYSIVLSGAHNNVQSVVRSSKQTSENPPTALTPPGAEKFPEKAPRYHYKFWAAFSVPLNQGTRYLNLHDFNFQDSKPSTGDFAQIDASLIATEQVENRDAFIQLSIEKWISENGFHPDRFFAKGDGKQKASAKSLLEAVIETLDRQQLASTTLSLDVVADLLRKEV